MSTSLETSISGVIESVMADHQDAMREFWPVQAAIFDGTARLQALSELLEYRKQHGPISEAEMAQIENTCRMVLAAATLLAHRAAEINGRFKDKIEKGKEFNEAVCRLRVKVVDLQNIGIADPTASLDYQKLIQSATNNPPPQSWFEEDFTGLRGPFAALD